MKRLIRTAILVGITAAQAAVMAGTLSALAQGSFQLPWSTQAQGCGSSSSPSYQLRGSFDQAAGRSLSPGHTLEGGFWPGVLGLQPAIPGDLGHDKAVNSSVLIIVARALDRIPDDANWD